MTQLSTQTATLGTSLLLNSAGSVFCMTVDSSHSHENSSAQFTVSTLGTFIDELTLQDKLTKKTQKIQKLQKAQNLKVAYWTKQEISSLVCLLREYGSDFTMIATKMTKSRGQIKRKFKVLEKRSSAFADAIFQKRLDNNTFKAIVDMEIEENDFFCV